MAAWQDRCERLAHGALVGLLATARAGAGSPWRAVGVLVTGAAALGVLSIGAAAVGQLAIGRARVGRLSFDRLDVKNLHIERGGQSG